MSLKKKSNDTIGNQTRDLPTCITVPQPTAPPRAPCPTEESCPKLEATTAATAEEGNGLHHEEETIEVTVTGLGLPNSQSKCSFRLSVQVQAAYILRSRVAICAPCGGRPHVLAAPACYAHTQLNC